MVETGDGLADQKPEPSREPRWGLLGVGVAIGIAISVALDNYALGLPIGLGVGLALALGSTRR